MKTLKIGDNVAYSVQFLRSIGMGATGSLARARGVITEIKALGSISLATVQWSIGGEEIPSVININNLALVGPNSKFCNVG